MQEHTNTTSAATKHTNTTATMEVATATKTTNTIYTTTATTIITNAKRLRYRRRRWQKQ